MVNKGAKTTPRRYSKTKGNKSYVKVQIFDEHYYELADSGSPLTLINKTIVPENYLQSIQPATTELVGANGSKLDVLGSLTISIGFPSESTQYEHNALIVNNLSETMLIGSDFLIENSCIINFSELTLTIKNNTVPLLKVVHPRSSKQTFNVTLTKTIKIPPLTIIDNVNCNLTSKNKTGDNRRFLTTTGILHPADKLLARKFNIKSPRLLINFRKGHSHIQLANTNDYEITVYRNQVIGKLQQLPQSTINILNESHPNENDENLNTVNTIQPESEEKLKRLFQKLKLDEKTHLSNDQISKVKQLISNYQHIFYDEESGKLPAAQLPEHKITLSTDEVIRVPYRRIPLALKREAGKLVKEMMDIPNIYQVFHF